MLESIYLDELQVVKGNGRSSPWEIYITLHPATAEDQDSQYVCFTLVLQVPAQYPHEVPEISIRNPRGLSDEQIHKISQALSHVANAGLGTAMLYELIEVRGMLTWQNVLFKLEQFVLREAMSLESNTSGVMKFLFK